MGMKSTYSFPNIQQRDRFLKLIAMNLPGFGYGFGLEFRGLEYSLTKERATGDLRDHIGNSLGGWTLQGRAVEIDWGIIVNARPNFDSLRDKLWAIARQFGAGQ